jgi:hypothetical protein
MKAKIFMILAMSLLKLSFPETQRNCKCIHDSHYFLCQPSRCMKQRVTIEALAGKPAG